MQQHCEDEENHSKDECNQKAESFAVVIDTQNFHFSAETSKEMIERNHRQLLSAKIVAECLFKLFLGLTFSG